MTLPLLGPITLSGFEHAWFFLFLLVVLGVVALYIFVQLARHRRMLRFANMELLESVAPKRPTKRRHLPAILLVIALVFLTVAMAGPTHEVRIPRNRAVVMLVMDVSQSMRATDVSPNRMAAAQEASKQFADELTPGINLGLIAYAGTATVLVSPTTGREATKAAIDKLQFADRTATGEGIFTALQAIATVGAVIAGIALGMRSTTVARGLVRAVHGQGLRHDRLAQRGGFDDEHVGPAPAQHLHGVRPVGEEQHRPHEPGRAVDGAPRRGGRPQLEPLDEPEQLPDAARSDEGLDDLGDEPGAERPAGLLPQVAQVEVVGPRRRLVEDLHGGDAGEVVEPGASVVSRREVPGGAGADQPVGVQAAFVRRDGAAAAVLDAYPAIGEHGVLQDVQVGEVAGRQPASGVDENALVEPSHDVARGCRECRGQLAAGRVEGVAPPEVADPGADHRGEERLSLVGCQSGDVGAEAGVEVDAAASTGQAVHRDARRGQALDVAQDRAGRDAELTRGPRGRHRPPGTKDPEQRQQPVCPHATKMPANDDIGRHVSPSCSLIGADGRPAVRSDHEARPEPVHRLRR